MPPLCPLLMKMMFAPHQLPLPVDELSPDAPLEEAAAAVAGIDAVVFPTAGVRTHFTQQACAQDFTWCRALAYTGERNIINMLISHQV